MAILTVDKGRLLVRNESEQLWIEAWGSGLRVRASHERVMPTSLGALEGEPREAVVELPAARNGAGAQPSREAETVCAIVRNGSIEARVAESGRLAFYDAHGKCLLEEFVRTQAPPRKGLLRIVAREFRPLYASGGFRTAQRFESDPSERLYGMGQYQQSLLNLKGCELELVQRNSQTTVPFVVSSLGYGFLWNNPAQGTVVFGANLTTWRSNAANCIDYWIVAGDTPAAILAAYGEVAGRPPAMPEWALGFWQSKCRYRTQHELLKVARRYRDLGIPLSAIVVDYFHWLFEGDLDFDRTYWPDPKAMVDELRAQGVEPIVSVWPTVDPQSRHFSAMKERGFLARAQRGPDEGLGCGARTQNADVTNPEARAYVWSMIRKTYRSYGFRAFWLDLAEPETATPDPDNFLYAAGTAAQVGNRYPLDYVRMFDENLRDEGEDQIALLIRSAWAGSQKYAALLWSGDIPSTFWSLRNQISIGLSAGMAGIPWWNCDAGGFFDADVNDPAFHELLARWFAFCTFTPVLRLHGSRDPQQPGPGTIGGGLCGSGADNEVWSYGPELQAILVAHIQLRERLRPYLRRIYREASETLAPLMRPMFFGAPKDPACRDVDDQFFFGPDLVVAPVYTPGARQRLVYLPADAVWRDVRTGEDHEGGQSIVSPAPLESIPVFARVGSAVLAEAFPNLP